MREISSEERSRALELILILRNPPYIPDKETAGPADELKKILGYPRVINLLFHENPELSDEEVVERALQYQPFVG